MFTSQSNRLLATLCPKGGTRTHDRPGVSLHHTLAARAIPGVRDALCAELRGANGALQRYVYVELASGVDLEPATKSIQSDPLFLGEETLVLPVDSVATLEVEGHGLVIERWGRAGGKGHQRLPAGGSVRSHCHCWAEDGVRRPGTGDAPTGRASAGYHSASQPAPKIDWRGHIDAAVRRAAASD
jgi:hypothetical protein